MKDNRIVLVAVLGMTLAGCSSLDRSRNLGDPNVPAKALAEQVCSNCHGLEGRSTNPNFPNLAAQQPTYVEGQLKAFRAQSRHDPAGFEYMWGISQHLTDRQIADLAEYYAGQQPARARPAADATLAAEGRNVFENGVPDKKIPPCRSCHGPQGEGSAEYPRIAGQHADYVVKQLMVFQRTEERPEGSVMKMVAHDLTPDSMNAVAAYLQGLATP